MAAIVDTKTGNITGAEEGTYEYYHEKCHLEFSESEHGQTVLYIAQMSEFFAIIFSVLTFFVDIFKWFALLCAFIMIVLFTYEEYFCNYIASKKFESEGKDNINNLKEVKKEDELSKMS